MTKSPRQSNKAIQGLLDEKRRIEEWLNRLETAADKTSEAVRERVEKDYRDRLEQVVQELEGHQEGLDRSLEQQREAHEALQEKELELSQRLSEAELRHEVGEYSEPEWTKLRTGILDSLGKVREELKTSEEEIASLEEVLASIEAKDIPVPELDEVELGEVVVEEMQEERAQAEQEINARTKPKQTDAFDELAFLKSVTEDKEHGPQPERASGKVQALTDGPEPAKKSGRKKGKELGASGVRSVTRDAQQLSKGTQKRSLKCQDCGAMNLPTEWYCESCGAELASV